jgi:hypothetical protein
VLRLVLQLERVSCFATIKREAEEDWGALVVTELSSPPDAVLVPAFSISKCRARFQKLRQGTAMTTKVR